MQYRHITYKNLWSHPYFRKQNQNGKLALCYLVFNEIDHVILEDMAFWTGLEQGECKSWVEQFNADEILVDALEVL